MNLFQRTLAPLILVSLSIVCQSSFAQSTAYISDLLYVPMRTGPSNEYRIINAAMKSGTKLLVLEKNDDGTWSRVRTEDGTEGWIPNQYLVSEMTAQLKLNQALTRLASIEKENARLKAENMELKSENTDLASSTQAESQTASRLQAELDEITQLSAGAIELDRRYQELLQKHELTQTQRDSLLAENENLKNDQRLSFLLYGAGILILGVILSLVLPALKPKKGYSEWK